MSELATKVKPLEILPYQAKYHKEVVELITTIQQVEFGLPIKYEDQFDLVDVERAYASHNSRFWTAVYDGEVVGTIGLIDSGTGLAVLKKLFVREPYRGKELSIAQSLLDTLFAWAKNKGVSHIYLGTTDKMAAAHRFYERNGFHVTPNDSLPSLVQKTRAKVDTLHYHKVL